jgi:hypothetical protein
MAKNSVIISVSITKEQAEWLDLTKESPSEYLQREIATRMQLWNTQHQEIDKYKQNIESLQKLLSERTDFLEEKGLIDEFVDYHSNKQKYAVV